MHWALKAGPWVAWLSAAVLTATSARAAAGTVEGRVVAAATGAPLVGAHVTLDGGALGDVTGDDGRFRIAGVAPGAVSLSASYVGYRTVTRRVTVPPDQPVQVDLALEVRLLPMDGVIVTARGRVSPAAELGGSAGVVDAPALVRANPVSLPAATAALAGVSIGSDMPWASRVQIRGLDRDHVAFLIDGNRVSTTSDVAAQFGLVSLADVERVEVLKGPISVLYGTGSTGGVVNAIPASGHFAATPRWELASSAAGETAADGLSGYTRVGRSAPRYFLMLSQSYRDYGRYRAGGGERVANSQFRDRQTHVHAGLRLTAAHVLGLRGQWFEATDVGIPGGAGVFPVAAAVSYPRTGRWLGEATWGWAPPNPGRWHRSEVKAFLQNIDRRAEVLPRQVQYLPAGNGQPLRRARPQSIEPAADHDVAGLRWNNEVALPGHALVFGLEGWQKRLRSERRRFTLVDVLRPDSTVVRTVESRTEDRSLPNSVYRPVGAYAEDEYRPSSRLTVDLGARIDLIHVDSERTFLTYVPPSDQVLWPPQRHQDVSWSVQTRLAYAFRPAWRAHVGLARSFRSPGLEERYLYVDLGDLVRIGDPALHSEDGLFVETGVAVRTGWAMGSAQAYWNRIRNLVIEVPATYEGRRALKKANAGAARLAGFDGEGSLRLGRHLLLSGALAYVRGTDEQKHQSLPAIAPLNGRLSAQVGGYEGTWAAVEGGFAARQDRVAPGESTTGGHFTVDLSAGSGAWRTGSLRHRLTIGARNLLDARYRDHLATSRGIPLYATGRSLYASWSTER